MLFVRARSRPRRTAFKAPAALLTRAASPRAQAVLVTILAAGFTNVGKALQARGCAALQRRRCAVRSAKRALTRRLMPPAQKRGMRTLPRLVYDAKVVREYLKHRTWTLGLALGTPRHRLVRMLRAAPCASR